MTTPQTGDIVEVVKGFERNEVINARVHDKFRVDEVQPALSPGDRYYQDPAAIQYALVSGYDSEYGTLTAPLASVRVVRKADQDVAPTGKELMGNVHFLTDEHYEFHESRIKSNGCMEFVVSSKETGRRYAFVLTLTAGPVEI